MLNISDIHFYFIVLISVCNIIIFEKLSFLPTKSCNFVDIKSVDSNV